METWNGRTSDLAWLGGDGESCEEQVTNELDLRE